MNYFKPNRRNLLFRKIILTIWFNMILYANAQTHQQQYQFFQSQLDSAQQEMNVGKMASVYGDIVDLCRNTSEFKNKLAESLYNYGLWSSYAGKHYVAINALIEILEMPEKPEDKIFKAGANMILGNTYFFMERWDEALTHYKKARDMAKELNNKQGLSIAENNIGNIYQKKGDFQQAIIQYQSSLQLQQEIGDEETICNTYYNIGTCNRELKQIDESIRFFEKAQSMAKDIGETEIQALSLAWLALSNAVEKKQFHIAEYQITKAETLAQNAGLNQVLKEVYMIRSIIEEEKGNFKTALEYHKKHKQVSDTLFNELSIDKLREYEVRYQTQEKEIEILRQKEVINHHRFYRYVYISVLIAAGVLLLLLFYIIRLHTKRNSELAEINATKDKFFSIISHDLKNPSISQRNALQLLAEKGSQFDTNTLSQYYSELLKSSDYQINLLNELLNWAQIQTGRMPYNPDTFDLLDAIRLEIALIQNMANQKNIDLKIQMPQEAVVTGDRNMLATIIRNLLTNAVKFTDKGGTVSLEIEPIIETTHRISISDTGIGISHEQIQNLFHIDKQHSMYGTSCEQGSGLGLIVCQELLKKHGSVLQVESTEGKGSRFWFEI